MKSPIERAFERVDEHQIERQQNSNTMLNDYQEGLDEFHFDDFDKIVQYLVNNTSIDSIDKMNNNEVPWNQNSDPDMMENGKSLTILENLKMRLIKSPDLSPVKSPIQPAALYLNKNQLLFWQIQMKSFDPNGTWTEEEKIFILTLFFKSPSYYEFLMYQMEFKLLDVDDIKAELGNFEMLPGFSEDLFRKLALKVGAMSSNERECIMMWGKTDINLTLINQSEGSLDLEEDDKKDCSFLLAFMLRGLKSTWKITIGYFFIDKFFNESQMIPLLFSCLNKCLAVNLKVKSMVCENDQINRNLISSLGISRDKPFFIYENEQIFFNYDIPHLFQVVRNVLTINDIIIDNELILLDPIKELYLTETDLNEKSLCQITEANFLNDDARRINVNLALKLFSNSVAKGLIKAALSNNLMKNPHSISTAKFIQRMNDLFDCLNSRHFKDSNYYKCAISEKSPQIQKYLENSIDWIKKWELRHVMASEDFTSDLILSINGILMIAKHLECLLTTRLNLDTLFYTFLSIKSQLKNDSYSADAFQFYFKDTVINDLIKPPSGSPFFDDDPSEEFLAQLGVFYNQANGDFDIVQLS